MERRFFKAVSLVVLVLFASACASAVDTQSDPADVEGEVKTFERAGVTFDYPGDWEAQGDAPVSMSMESEAFAEALGPDENNVVVVQSQSVGQELTQEQVEAGEATLDEAIRALIEGGNGEVTAGPDPLEAGGGFGYTWEFSDLDLEGTPGSGKAAIFFVGSNEYVVLCVFTDAEEEITAGCDQILETFAIDEA